MEEFSEINLTESTTFPIALVNRTKSRFNQKNDSSHDTKQLVCTSETNNSWNKQIFRSYINNMKEYLISTQIISMGYLILLNSRTSYNYIISKINNHIFILDCLMSQNKFRF